MLGFFMTWFINTLALLAVVNMMPGIRVEGWETAVAAALVLGFLNAFLKPVILLLTLPFNLLSLGFFTLLVNGFMFYLVSKVVPGFAISGFWAAFFGAILFSIVTFFFNLFIGPEGKFKRIDIRFYRSGSAYQKNDDVIDVEGRSKEEGGIEKKDSS